MNWIKLTRFPVFSRLAVLVAVGIIWVLPVSLHAASILWGTPKTISGDTDVTNATGTLAYAYTGGSAGATVNGVVFAAGNSGTAWGGSVSFSGFGTPYNLYNGGTSTPWNNLSTAYKTVLQGGAYGGAGSGTVTLNGLTFGHAYTLQIWANDARSTGSGRTETANSGNSVTLKYNSTGAVGGVGQYVLGTFVADSASQSFTLSSSTSVQLNALELRDNGYVSATATLVPSRYNLAKYQTVLTDSTNGTQSASYITQGFVDDDSCWISGNSGPHWAEVVFPFPVTVGSAQVAMGQKGSSPMTIFYFQYLTNGNWVTVSGSTVVNNTNLERNVVFSSPVTGTAFRLYDSLDSPIRIRQLALYPPHGASGYPFGTDFNIDLARKQPAFGTANTQGGWPLLAADGLVNPSSAWQTTLVGSNSLLINLQFTNKIGSAHLYSGMNGVPPLSNFVLQYWNGGAWQNIPGGAITGNSQSALVIPFTTPVSTTEVQLLFTNAGTSAVQEMCVFPANSGNVGYPLGTGIVSNTPVTAKYDTYSDSYYYLSNSASAGVIVESNGAPVMGNVVPSTWATASTNWAGQYQVLLNYDSGTYRLINRNSGLCLAGSQLSTNAGAALAEETYTALPDQDWYLQSVDGVNFYLVNQFSGLVADNQGGALVQNASTNSASQLWQISPAQIFPKKGMAGIGGGYASLFSSAWVYGWWYGPNPNLPGVNYCPMDFDGYYYRGGNVANNLWGLQPGWRSTGYSLYALGYNEPDNVGQGTIDATNGAIRWASDQNLDLPLVAPAAGNINGTWNPIFYGYITNWGYRADYLPGHEYPGNNSSGSSSIWINALQTAYNTYGIPIWMTEWSVADWGGTGNWSQEDNYNALVEFLWRAESISWLRKYSLYPYFPDYLQNSGHPANPWTRTTPAPCSACFDTNGVMNPFGEVYGGWDDDASVETNKTYYVYNSSTRKQMANLGDSQLPDAKCILVRDTSTRWVLQPSPTSGQYYLVSSVDGRRLSYNGSAVTLAASNTIGTAVQWALTPYQYGWYYLDHPATSLRLQLAYNNSTFVATYSMVSQSTTSTAVQWHFIVPYTPAPVVWTGGVNASWANSTNWSPRTLNPAVNQTTGNNNVIFNNLSALNLNTILNFSNNPAVSNQFTVYGITVSNPPGSVSISATNKLVIGSFIDLSQASQDLTINTPLYFGESEGFGRQQWTVAPGRTLTINGGADSANDLIVSGGGTVLLGGDSGYTGNTFIKNGLVDFTGSYLGSTNGTKFVANGGTIEFDLGSGSATFYGDGYANSPLIGDGNYTGAMIVQSGTVNIQTMTNGSTASLRLGDNGSVANGTLTVNGGTLNVPGRILMGANTAGAHGTLTLTGGTVNLGTVGGGSYVDPGAGVLWFGNYNSTVNLFGGKLALYSLYNPGSGSVTVTLSGGTVQAINNNGTFGNGRLTLNVSTNGVTVDPAGWAIGITNGLAHDGGLAGADGGLTVADSVGGGTLTLSGANSYTGPTWVNAGTLALSGSGSLASVNLLIAGGAKLDVSGLAGTLVLGAGQALSASAASGDPSGILNLGAGAGVTLSSGGLKFTQYGGGGTAPLALSGAGSLQLNGAPVTVTTTSTLFQGNYKLVAKGGSAVVTGTPGTVTVNGSGLAGGLTAQLSVLSGELWLNVSGTVSGISVSGTPGPFVTTYGTPSAPQNFGVTASGLTADVVATAPVGLQVASDGVNFGGTATFTNNGGSASGTLSVELGGMAAAGNYNSQAVVLSSPGVTSVNLATSGSGNKVNPLTINVTANAQSIVYGQADPVLTYNATPSLLGSDHFSGALSRAAGANVGSYAINQGTLSLSANYQINYSGANLTISPANLVVTANADQSTYGAGRSYGPGSTNFTASGLQLGDVVGSVTITASGGDATNSAPGSYTLTPSAAQFSSGLAGNYNISYQSGTLTVSPALLGVTADDQVMGYGSTNPVLTASFSGFVNGESVTNSDVVGAPELTTGATPQSPVGSYVITNNLGTLASTNYTFGLTNGTLTVVAANLNAMVGVADKTYDGTTNATITSETLAGVVNGDNVSLTGGVAGFADKNVGVSKPVTVSGLSLSGSGATNYALVSGTVSTNASITAVALMVNAVPDTRVYDGTTLSAGVPTNYPALLGSDTGNFSQQFDTATVGTGKTLTPAGVVNDGYGGNNYSYSYVPVSSGEIDPAALGITADSTNKVFGQSLSFAGTEFTATGLVGGDGVTSVTLSSAGATNTAGAGTYAIVPSAAVGTGLGNYTISYTNGVLTVTGVAAKSVMRIVLNADGSRTLTFTGATNQTYRLLAATNLSAPVWVTLSTNTLTGTGSATFVDTNTAGIPFKFYRTIDP